jgi:hypothetical protein
MRHPTIPGGLREPEQREHVKIGLTIKKSGFVKRTTGMKKAFIIKKKR